MSFSIEKIHAKSFRGSPPFKYAQIRGTGDSDHASWWSFDDEQGLRDAFWHVRPGDTVLDIGAAFGSYALPALACGARVVCFSPADFDTQLLELNLSLNPELAARCLVLRDGLYSRDGWFQPDRCDFVAGLHAIPEADRPRWLAVHALDSILLERPGINKISLIKIDVEGAELEVLKGAEQCLLSDRPRILVENHEFQKKGIELEVRDYLVGLGIGYVCNGPHQHCAVSHSFFEVPGG